jgi:exosome complex component RRP42
MSPSTANLSPAELAYLHSSLALNPPIRPDARTPTQFRPLVAETDILPSANGSARICFADGTEAVVGVKAEVEKMRTVLRPEGITMAQGENEGQEEWVELSVEIPEFRDDDGLPIFLAELLREGLVGEEGLQKRLVINRGWHWRLIIDVSFEAVLSSTANFPLSVFSIITLR